MAGDIYMLSQTPKKHIAHPHDIIPQKINKFQKREKIKLCLENILKNSKSA
jgi:hypothetical protein